MAARIGRRFPLHGAGPAVGSVPAVSSPRDELVKHFHAYMASGDEDALRSLYDTDAVMIRFNGTSSGVDEIVGSLAAIRTRHAPYELHDIEQEIHAGDVVMWDAVVSTDEGMLQTTDVVVLGDDGRILRHIPGLRGYWGR